MHDPVQPTRPMVWPWVTLPPSDTEMVDWCPFSVAMPPPWSMIVALP